MKLAQLRRTAERLACLQAPWIFALARGQREEDMCYFQELYRPISSRRSRCTNRPRTLQSLEPHRLCTACKARWHLLCAHEAFKTLGHKEDEAFITWLNPKEK